MLWHCAYERVREEEEKEAEEEEGKEEHRLDTRQPCFVGFFFLCVFVATQPLASCRHSALKMKKSKPHKWGEKKPHKTNGNLVASCRRATFKRRVRQQLCWRHLQHNVTSSQLLGGRMTLLPPLAAAAAAASQLRSPCLSVSLSLPHSVTPTPTLAGKWIPPPDSGHFESPLFSAAASW